MLNDRELSTVLAALRYYQRNDSPAMPEIAPDPLDEDEIDELCETINRPDPAETLMDALKDCRTEQGAKAWSGYEPAARRLRHIDFVARQALDTVQG